MRRFIGAVVCAVGLLPGVSGAEELRLAVPEALKASGLAQFIVPRFSLKTSVRITRVDEGAAAEMQFTDGGTAVFQGAGQRWGLEHNGDPRAVRFLDWLRSDVGKRTIESFTAEDGTTYSAELTVVKAELDVSFDGDSNKGEALSLTLCGRCHVINESNRMNGMGSTPSFRVLRSFSDWDRRFANFHLLNPHPSFTQIDGVTDPFDPSLPSPIVPVELTVDDLEAILAYVSGVTPADLGAPLQLQ
ncbi:hypothetical protein [uncultured Roseobacter sp.]|uniref:hypothetical protein n=1 Tax=uncultured Roseobacter sp. TaxID=114847 RepID=UPI002620B414|nr:hypothetical protein [uncultured Roseobacter sp.]